MIHRTSTTLTLAALLGMPLSAPGQSLSEEFSQLFTFGDCGLPLCLSVNESVHGQHYIPSVTQGESNLLAFLSGAISKSVGNLPATASSSGVTFTIEDGVPVQTSVSAGPIFAERAQTLGEGRLLVGVNVSQISFSSIRGVPMDGLRLAFGHQNVGGAALGDPTFENDLIEVSADLDLSLLATNLFASYGLTDNFDVAVLVPLIRSSLEGSAVARVIHFESASPHFFGTDANPTTEAQTSADGTALGVGDIGLRAKANLYQTDNAGAALLTDVRLPTGADTDFLGSGEASLRALTIFSGRLGGFAPHANAGFVLRGGDLLTNSLLLSVGFDQLVSETVTMAIDVVSDFQMGVSQLDVPTPIEYSAPFPRSEQVTDIPDESDHVIDASWGLKVQIPGDFRAVGNVLIPLNDGGLRPDFLWTAGLELNF